MSNSVFHRRLKYLISLPKLTGNLDSNHTTDFSGSTIKLPNITKVELPNSSYNKTVNVFVLMTKTFMETTIKLFTANSCQ